MKSWFAALLVKVWSAFVSMFVIAVLVFVVLRVAGAPIHLVWFERVASGNLGYAATNSRPVLTELLERLPGTLALIALSFIVSVVVGLIGALLSLSKWPLVGPPARAVMTALRCVPIFWIALVLQWSFGVHDAQSAAAVSLPVALLALFQVSDYTEYLAGRLRGRSGRKEWMPLGVLRVFAQRLPQTIGAAVVLEFIFGWPGEGRLFIDSLAQGDLTVLTGFVLLNATLVLVLRFAFAPTSELRSSAKRLTDV